MNDTLAVVDASLIVPAVGQAAKMDALVAQASGQRLHAPTLLFIESANAFWKSAKAGLYDDATAEALLEAAYELPITLHQDAKLLPEALRTANALRHPVYDCLYLALAVELDCAVLTADRRFAGAVTKAPDLAARVRVLAA